LNPPPFPGLATLARSANRPVGPHPDSVTAINKDFVVGWLPMPQSVDTIVFK